MTYIFESPDGGHTVYRRRPGQIQRELYSVSELEKQRQESYHRFIRWQKILEAAKTNPALNEAVERAEVLYQLTQHDD